MSLSSAEVGGADVSLKYVKAKVVVLTTEFCVGYKNIFSIDL